MNYTNGICLLHFFLLTLHLKANPKSEYLCSLMPCASRLILIRINLQLPRAGLRGALQTRWVKTQKISNAIKARNWFFIAYFTRMLRSKTDNSALRKHVKICLNRWASRGWFKSWHWRICFFTFSLSFFFNLGLLHLNSSPRLPQEKWRHERRII